MQMWAGAALRSLNHILLAPGISLPSVKIHLPILGRPGISSKLVVGISQGGRVETKLKLSCSSGFLAFCYPALV